MAILNKNTALYKLTIKTDSAYHLPHTIVVGHTYIQHFDEKSISKHEYYCIIGIKKSLVDKQGELAKYLCAHAGIRVKEYNNGSKAFGMEEVKLFVPKYGIALHNSLMANSKCLLKTKRLCLRFICSTSIVISMPSQSHQDFLEHIIGVCSATSATMIR